MQVALIPRESLGDMLPHVLAVLSRALVFSRGRYTLEKLREDILEQKKLLWAVFDPGRVDAKIYGAMLTAEGAYPGFRVLRVDYLAGEEMNEWIQEAQTALLRYARFRGLDRLEMSGRPGWTPVLQKLGWTVAYVTLEKDVANVGKQRVDAGNGAECQSVPVTGISPDSLQ